MNSSSYPIRAHQLTKTYATHVALKSLDLEIEAHRIVGLIGRNGAGKSTLLHLACGLVLPTGGTCETLGQRSSELGAAELSRIGLVSQQGRFLDWMTVEQQLHFQGSFYTRWDKAREQRLLTDLELDPHRKIVELSPGDQQKLGVVLAVCHHPDLVLLDEPMSALDPIVRARMISFLVDLMREDGSTIVVSSHTLGDVEKIVDWLVCLDRGKLVLNASLDDVQESYAEWIVSSPDGTLPARFVEPWVLSHSGDARQARLIVRVPNEHECGAFATAHRAGVERRPANLEQLFPALIGGRRTAA
jgi:ABC-2 type transport system ATP-binding protein